MHILLAPVLVLGMVLVSVAFAQDEAPAEAPAADAHSHPAPATVRVTVQSAHDVSITEVRIDGAQVSCNIEGTVLSCAGRPPQ